MEITDDGIKQGIEHAYLGKRLADEMLKEFDPIIEKHANKWEKDGVPFTVAAQAIQTCAIKFTSSFIGCAKDAEIPDSLIAVLIKVMFHHAMKELEGKNIEEVSAH